MAAARHHPGMGTRTRASVETISPRCRRRGSLSDTATFLLSEDEEAGTDEGNERSALLKQRPALAATPLPLGLDSAEAPALCSPRLHESRCSLGLARIFTIVNVMLGSSLLVFPWAFEGSGLLPGTFLVFSVGWFCHYTSSLILRWSDGFDDFSDMCLHYLGPVAWHVSLVASLIVLFGALLAYHTLMSDFLHALLDLYVPQPAPAEPGAPSTWGVIMGILRHRSMAPVLQCECMCVCASVCISLSCSASPEYQLRSEP